MQPIMLRDNDGVLRPFDTTRLSDITGESCGDRTSDSNMFKSFASSIPLWLLACSFRNHSPRTWLRAIMILLVATTVLSLCVAGSFALGIAIACGAAAGILVTL